MRWFRAWSPWHLRAAMRHVIRYDAGGRPSGCSGSTGTACRFWPERSRDSVYSADRWCDSCILTDALEGGAA